MGLIGCVLNNSDVMPKAATIVQPAAFYMKGNSEIWSAMLKMKHFEINSITVTDRMHGGNWEQDRLSEHLTACEQICHSSAMWKVYADIVLEKQILRKIVTKCAEVTEKVYGYSGPIEDLLWDVKSDLFEAAQVNSPTSTEEIWGIDQLYDFKIDSDPNAVIGVKHGKTTRFLCKSFAAWLIGQTGSGKSSLLSQLAFGWAAGKSVWGIMPIKPLRILIVQAENDIGDAAEFTQGIFRSMGIDPMSETFDLLRENIRIVTERRTTGARFCDWLGRKILDHKADVVFVDPFLSFAGVNVGLLHECSIFLRSHLNPVLVETGAILINAHHTGKPKFDKNVKTPTALDYAYAGIGSSELVNWARAAMVLLSLGDGRHYELKLAKRGMRAGARHPDVDDIPGDFTTSIFLRQCSDHIYWEQIPPADEPGSEAQPTQQGGQQANGRPSKVMQIAASDLSGFLNSIPPKGDNGKDTAVRLERWLAGRFEDVSARMCEKVIPLLVANQKLVKTGDRLYMKGPRG